MRAIGEKYVIYNKKNNRFKFDFVDTKQRSDCKTVVGWG